MALAEGKVGPVQRSDGSQGETRLGRTGEVIVAEAHGRYFEAAARGAIFHAAMQAGAAFGTTLTAAAATLTLYNPAGSNVLLVLLHASAALTAAPAGNAALVYAVSTNPVAAPPAAVTPAVVRCSRLGPSTGKGLAYTAATLPGIPAVARILGNFSANASAGIVSDDLNGALVIPENTAVTIQGMGAATTGIVALSWEEVQA